MTDYLTRDLIATGEPSQ